MGEAVKIVVITDAAETGLGAQRVWIVSDDQAEAVAATLGEPEGSAVVDLDALDTSAITLLDGAL